MAKINASVHPYIKKSLERLSSIKYFVHKLLDVQRRAGRRTAACGFAPKLQKENYLDY